MRIARKNTCELREETETLSLEDSLRLAIPRFLNVLQEAGPSNLDEGQTFQELLASGNLHLRHRFFVVCPIG